MEVGNSAAVRRRGPASPSLEQNEGQALSQREDPDMLWC